MTIRNDKCSSRFESLTTAEVSFPKAMIAVEIIREPIAYFDIPSSLLWGRYCSIAISLDGKRYLRLKPTNSIKVQSPELQIQIRDNKKLSLSRRRIEYSLNCCNNCSFSPCQNQDSRQLNNLDEPKAKLLGVSLPFYIISFAPWCRLAPKVELCRPKAMILFVGLRLLTVGRMMPMMPGRWFIPSRAESFSIFDGGLLFDNLLVWLCLSWHRSGWMQNWMPIVTNRSIFLWKLRS